MRSKDGRMLRGPEKKIIKSGSMPRLDFIKMFRSNDANITVEETE